MTSEELFFMRHPNRLRTRQGGARRAPPDATKERAGRFHSAQPTAGRGGQHRKRMQNFSLRPGPPLWLILREGRVSLLLLLLLLLRDQFSVRAFLRHR